MKLALRSLGVEGFGIELSSVAQGQAPAILFDESKDLEFHQTLVGDVPYPLHAHNVPN